MGFKAGKRTQSLGFAYSNILNVVGRFIQIVFACVVIGFYGMDLHKANKVGGYSDSKWSFAVAVGSFAAVTALIFAIVGFFSQYRTIALLFAWEWIIAFMWVIVSGIFGNMYLKENAEMDGGVQRMKTAAAFDLVNMIFWIISASVGTAVFFMSDRKSLFTGRATL